MDINWKDYIVNHLDYSTIEFIYSLCGLTFTGVDNQSLAEETEKAFLKLSDEGEWKQLLDSAESHSYLWGQVRCLLSWADRDINLFADYYQRLSALFAYDDKNHVYAGIMSIDPSYGFANNKLYYCCPLKVSEQRDIHPQCCCNGIADDFSEGKPLS